MMDREESRVVKYQHRSDGYVIFSLPTRLLGRGLCIHTYMHAYHTHLLEAERLMVEHDEVDRRVVD